MNFNDEVKKHMQDKGLKPSDLAKATGYSLQYILDLLKGHRRWNETTINKVCVVLGVKIKFTA
jgi:predicted transcriptional regulator